MRRQTTNQEGQGHAQHLSEGWWEPALLLGLALVVLLVAAASTASGAQAKSAGSLIVINEGIGSVRIGQTAQQVRKEAGKPTSTLPYSSGANWYYDNKPPFAAVDFGSNKRVSFLAPNSRGDKTSRGIGEGSSQTQVRAAYPNANCAPQPGPGGKTDMSCNITKHLPSGKTVETSFIFSTANGSGGVNELDMSEF